MRRVRIVAVGNWTILLPTFLIKYTINDHFCN